MRAKGTFKSTILIVIFSLIFLLSSASMQAAPGKYSFGLNLGPIFSNQWSTGDTPGGYEKPIGQSGLSLGIFSNLRLGKRFSLQGEILFSEKGARHNLVIAGFPFGPVDVTYKTDYIEIPLWLKYYVINKRTFKIYTGAGGYMAFLTKGRYLFENEFIPNFTEEMENLKKSDVGVVFNWGLEVKAAHYSVNIEYRYSMGFSNIAYPTGPGAPEIELRNLAPVILVGISFNL